MKFVHLFRTRCLQMRDTMLAVTEYHHIRFSVRVTTHTESECLAPSSEEWSRNRLGDHRRWHPLEAPRAEPRPSLGLGKVFRSDGGPSLSKRRRHNYPEHAAARDCFRNEYRLEMGNAGRHALCMFSRGFPPPRAAPLASLGSRTSEMVSEIHARK